jgi:hypothetical protein
MRHDKEERTRLTTRILYIFLQLGKSKNAMSYSQFKEAYPTDASFAAFMAHSHQNQKRIAKTRIKIAVAILILLALIIHAIIVFT